MEVWKISRAVDGERADAVYYSEGAHPDVVAAFDKRLAELVALRCLRLSDLRAEIDRLKDLRRWRPMTEAPIIPRGRMAAVVLVRDHVRGAYGYGYFNGDWLWDGLPSAVPEDMWWTYIPGHEPEEA